MVEIIQAGEEHIGHLTPLFDAYRVFYKQPPAPESAREFLLKRLRNEECVVFLAKEEGHSIGFTLLYPSFSSVSMQAQYILNDLFVDSSFRGRGVGKMLLQRAKEHCILHKCKGLALETATDNPAQHLYEKLDWVKDNEVFHYFWTARTD